MRKTLVHCSETIVHQVVFMTLFGRCADIITDLRVSTLFIIHQSEIQSNQPTPRDSRTTKFSCIIIMIIMNAINRTSAIREQLRAS